MKMKFWAGAMALILAWGSSGHAAAETWRISFSVTEDHSWSQALQEWAQLVEDGTDGAVDFSLHYNDGLGNQNEVLEGIRLGVAHGTYALEPLSAWVPEVNLFSIPYLFRDEAHIRAALEGELRDYLDARLAEQGFRAMMYFVREPRNITSNFPIESVSDLEGFKVRVPQGTTTVEMFRAFGANPAALPWSEVFPGLEAGVIDGQENPLDLIWEFKLFDVQSHVAVTEHQRAPVIFVVPEAAFQRLSPEHQQVMLDAAAVAQASENARFAAEAPLLKERLEEAGMQFTYPDQDEFRAAVAGTFEVVPDYLEELVEIVRSIEE